MVDEKRLEEYLEKVLSAQSNVVYKGFNKSRYQPDDRDWFEYFIKFEDKGKTSNFAYGEGSLSFTFDSKGILQYFAVCLSSCDYDGKTEEYCKSLYSDWDSFDEAKKKEISDTYHHAIFYKKGREYFEFPTDFSEFVKEDDDQIKECLMKCAESDEVWCSEEDVEDCLENNNPIILCKRDYNVEATCQRLDGSSVVYVFDFSFKQNNFEYKKHFVSGYIEKIVHNLTDIYWELEEQNWEEEMRVIEAILVGFGEEI